LEGLELSEELNQMHKSAQKQALNQWSTSRKFGSLWGPGHKPLSI